VEALLDADPLFEVDALFEGRDPFWPEVLKFPFLMLLFTVRELFLLLLLYLL
jgi:hypothetical protein